jgi:hypothetical protein
VIAHELGHAVGVAHLDAGVMTDTLATGTRTIAAATSVTTVPALTAVAPQLLPAVLRSLGEERSVPEMSLPGVAAPQINWSHIQADTPPQIRVATPAKAAAWQSDFVNHLARNEAQRNANANLRVQINLAPKLATPLSALHSIV